MSTLTRITQGMLQQPTAAGRDGVTYIGEINYIKPETFPVMKQVEDMSIEIMTSDQTVLIYAGTEPELKLGISKNASKIG